MNIPSFAGQQLHQGIAYLCDNEKDSIKYGKTVWCNTSTLVAIVALAATLFNFVNPFPGMVVVVVGLLLRGMGEVSFKASSANTAVGKVKTFVNKALPWQKPEKLVSWNNYTIFYKMDFPRK